MRTRPLRRLGLGLGVACAALLLLELALRLTLPLAARATLPNEEIAAHLSRADFVYDPDLFWYWAEPPEGATAEEFGFRVIEPITQDKPEGVVRAIAFGDSQTFGAGLSPEEAWPGQADAALGARWQVLNAAVPGYRSLNVRRLLSLRMQAYAPDYVLVDCMPFDSPRDDGRLFAVGPATPTARLQALLWHSRLYFALRLAVEKADPRRARWLDQAQRYLNGRDMDLGNHDLIASWAEDHGARAVFLTYAVMEGDGAVSCHTRPGELPEGLPVVDACAALAATGLEGHALFQDRNHFTAQGARVVGQAVARTLAALEAER
ncbi:MAG: hypothetical protein H6741_33265 [Alphaproteobacteria bacterium]|nr:hypothetical protein [Alphaproteobacteria bacterium]